MDALSHSYRVCELPFHTGQTVDLSTKIGVIKWSLTADMQLASLALSGAVFPYGSRHVLFASRRASVTQHLKTTSLSTVDWLSGAHRDEQRDVDDLTVIPPPETCKGVRAGHTGASTFTVRQTSGPSAATSSGQEMTCFLGPVMSFT